MSRGLCCAMSAVTKKSFALFLLIAACSHSGSKKELNKSQETSGQENESQTSVTQAFIDANKNDLVKVEFVPPMLFQGHTPCAGCEGNALSLFLLDAKTYVLEQSAGSRNYRMLGRWEYNQDMRILKLSSDSKTSISFGTMAGPSLAWLDQLGYPLTGQGMHQLTWVKEISVPTGSLNLIAQLEHEDGKTYAIDCKSQARLAIKGLPKNKKVKANNHVAEFAEIKAHIEFDGEPVLLVEEHKEASKCPENP